MTLRVNQINILSNYSLIIVKVNFSSLIKLITNNIKGLKFFSDKCITIILITQYHNHDRSPNNDK